MWKQKLAMATSPALETPTERQIELFAEAGFEGFSTNMEGEADVSAYKKLGDSLGLVYQSVHAPFHDAARVSNMWEAGDAGKTAARELCRCLEICAENEVGIMVSHVYIGFDYEKPTDTTARIGLENFGKVVKRADELGVKVAFENTEGEEFLDILLRGFWGESAVGFCLDTGHEQCYNYGHDLLALYGEKLIATHINDNLGIRRFDGVTQPRDDLHLLPFDGIIDWNRFAKRLDEVGYRGIMTCELKKNSCRDRHTNDRYTAMSDEVYIAEAYRCACKVAAMRNVKQI